MTSTRRDTQTARSLALDVLLDCATGDAFVQEVLDRHLSRSALSDADRRLVAQIVYGVLRRRGTLDALIHTAVTREKHQVEAWLWEALRIGVYQLALLSNIPPHAAINETVEVAAQVGKPRGKGFINAVLRNINSLLTRDEADGPARDSLPVADGRYLRLARPVLPDQESDPIGYLAAGFSWPPWLAQRWHARYGTDECVRLGFWFAGQAPLYLRCNTLLTDRDAVLAALDGAGVRAEAGTRPSSIRLLDHAPIQSLPGYADGLFAVQDESAMGVAEALAPEPGQTVLDLCAAPGGKTTHLAEIMKNSGRIVACDIDPRRLQTLRTLAERLRLTIIDTQSLDAGGGQPRRRKGQDQGTDDNPPLSQVPADFGPFDAALVDVPCSNTGVLGRRPEVRWRLRPDDLRHLVELQRELLLRAVDLVRPGGAVVYSTCSIEPEENRGVIDAALAACGDLTLEAEQYQTPGRPADGGYWARLRRRE